MLKVYLLNVIFSVKHFNLFSCSILPQVLESFSAKDQIGHVLVFEGHIISVAATQLCYWNAKAATAWMCPCFIQVYLQKEALG